jgi:hypothetical protein
MLYKGTRINTGDIGCICEAFMNGIRSGLESLGATNPLPKEFENPCDDGTANTIFQCAEEFLPDRVRNTLTKFVTTNNVFRRDGDTGELVFVASAALEYMQKAHAINDNILGAMFLGTGMPSRASELTTILYCGDSLVDRQLFVEPSPDGPIIRTRVCYNKVRNLSPRTIVFFFFFFVPDHVGPDKQRTTQGEAHPPIRVSRTVTAHAAILDRCASKTAIAPFTHPTHSSILFDRFVQWRI